MPKKRPIGEKPTAPDGWITRDELLAATGVSERNLVNWRAAGFVPEPRRLFLGGGRGTAAFYRVESVAMIRRLHELQGQGRDADAWLWGLWLDPADYPVDIRPWTLRRVNRQLKAIKEIGDDPAQIERHVDDELGRGRAAGKMRRKGMSPPSLRDLASWAYSVAADIEQQKRLD